MNIIQNGKNEQAKTYSDNREIDAPFIVTKFDTVSKIDSISTVADFVWKKVGENSFQEANDSIFRRKLCQVDFYDDALQESKFFDYKSDYYNKNLFQSGYTKYERDPSGRIKKETQIQDEKYYYFLLEMNGKYREEIKNGNYANTSSIVYEYDKDDNLKTRIHSYQGNISNQIQFVYQSNQIEKFFFDTWGRDKNDLKTIEIIFRYKYDKHKNWTEVTKNVDGKDMYRLIREITYY